MIPLQRVHREQDEEGTAPLTLVDLRASAAADLDEANTWPARVLYWVGWLAVAGVCALIAVSMLLMLAGLLLLVVLALAGVIPVQVSCFAIVAVIIAILAAERWDAP